VLATQSGAYAVRISAAAAAAAAAAESDLRLSLVVVGSPDRGQPLDIPIASGSLAEPADHPLVLTLGALRTVSDDAATAAAAFSSRGPTNDGRLKPDLLAPTGLPGASISGFAGTSASAPHAAGAAALLREALPSADRAALVRELRGRAIDIGAPGLDVETGAGLLSLGSLSGLGLLRPTGADEASLAGVLPTGAGFAVVIYRGPDGYPARFAHLLTPASREPVALFRPNGAGSFDRYLPGAPALVQSITTVEHGDALLLRFGPLD